MCRLRSLLQVAECMPFFKIQTRRAKLLCDISVSPIELQEVSENRIRISDAGYLWLSVRIELNTDFG